MDKFGNQSLDFYGAVRARMYDEQIGKWIEDIGGEGQLAKRLVNSKARARRLPLYISCI